MSFFYDLMQTFNLKDLDGKLTISLIFDVGVCVIGKFKLIDINEEEVIIESNKIKYKIVGKNLLVKSISKGEIVISGNVFKLEKCEEL